MQIHNLVQGSPEWQAFRLEHFGASEAAAMLGISTRVKRTELLHMKHTGTAQEFSDWVQENILDHGHYVEALARPLVEDMIGTELYPVTCSDGLLSASCDGLTMAEDVAFEHKQWNQALADAIAAGQLPDEYMPQPQQIIMVTGCSKVVFVCSDGTLDNFVHIDVLPDPAWQERIRAGWTQFAADLAAYEPREYAPKPEAEPIMSLPALAIQIRGEVAASNLPAFQARAERFIASIKTDLVTDQDFADAEAIVKFCEKAEGDLDHAKRAALEQTVDIAELMRTLDHIREQLRAKRLTLQTAVKDKKELIKAGILANAKQAFADHVAKLEKEIAPLRLVFQARDFAGAMKNKRTLATLQDAVDTELANGKIAVDAVAQAVRGRLAWYGEHAADHEFLFADLQTIIQKPDDDFQMVVRTRIDNHKRAEDLKAEQARQAAAAQVDAAPAAAAAAEPAPAPAPAAQVTRIAAVRPAAASSTPPSLRLGQISDRLGFPLTGDFLGKLGFAPAATDKSARLYHERDFPAICAALIDHINAVSQAQQAA
ncbi:Phage-related protein, predicted endonuclease [Massilia sp. PDC64]|nr:YqaJ viral recombinase family protein [Massilia sp. PDC64]SDC70483.1 Phage-related protein, predicted endonuclease [Massilia sp. PDC64]